MLINFELTSVEEVAPWGGPGNQSLHWFGLTEGRYWIDVGENTLFEYSERVRLKHFDRYCKYYAARIFEDITNMLTSILDPVPHDLVQYVSGRSGRAWIKMLESWSERNLVEGAGDEIWDVWDRANLLLSDRSLDSAYLTPSTSIVMWSDEADVHIEWENGDKLIDGELAWSAVTGSYHLPREKFVKEVGAFYANLFEQMTSRIEKVAAGALHADIHIDLPGLISENEQRREGAAQTLRRKGQASWDEIRLAILAISSSTARGSI